MSDVYWRILTVDGMGPTVACLQDFDERDYDQSSFLTDKKFSTENEARDELDRMIGSAVRLLQATKGGSK